MRSRPRPIAITVLLELQSGGPRAVGYLFDAAVEQEAVAVEDHRGDVALAAQLGDALADLARRSLVAGRDAVELHRRHRRDRTPALVGDDLHVGVAVAAEHTQSRPLVGAAHAPADALLAA